MQRTDDARAEADLFGTGKDGFRDKVVGPPVVPGTYVNANVLNAFQEEIARTVERGGAVLDSASYVQLSQAIDTYVAAKLAVNMTARTAGGGYGNTFNGAGFGGGYFVLVGNAAEIQSSPDGITWTHRAADSFASFLYSAHHGDGVYVLGGASGEIQSAATVPVTWAHRTAAASYSGSFKGGCYFGGAGLHVLVGATGEIQTSPDGTTWTHRSNAGGTADFGGVACSGTAVVAVGNGVIHRSTNGTSWSDVTSTNTVGTTPTIAYDSDRERFVIVSGAYTVLHSEDDGATWTEETVTNASMVGSGFAIGAGVMMCSPYAGAGVYAEKAYGTWTLNDAGGVITAGALNAAAYGNGRFVVAGNSALILSSLVVT